MTTFSNSLKIIEFDKASDMMIAYPLVTQMYKDMSSQQYRASIEEMITVNNYRMIAVFLDEKLVGVCGYWIFLMLYCGRYIQASNLIVDEKNRGKGIGKLILNYIENIGHQHECKRFVLDSYTENKKSHPLYFREGFYIRGFHFMKNLD